MSQNWIVPFLLLTSILWAQPSTETVADFGLTTRAPTAEEIRRFDLDDGWVRTAGRLLVSVDPKGPAAKASLRAGDAILRLEKNVLYSDDDLRDYERVSRPGTTVRVEVSRARTPKKREWVKLVLGSRTVTRVRRVRWQFASQGQLPAALESAKKQERWVLVGLSGAET